MPELPEVETIKEDLRGLVIGATIERAEVLAPPLVEQPTREEFVERLEGVGVSGARRRAKHLVVDLALGDSLVFQLKIGGQLLLVPPVEEPRRRSCSCCTSTATQAVLEGRDGLHAGEAARRGGTRGAALVARA
jgi:formamidopyrimidine-DNA glycosylase